MNDILRWFRQLFGPKPAPPPTPQPVPPRPDGWDKTLDDLIAEAQATPGPTTIGHPETTWAREYEESQLPADTYFPEKGDVFVAKKDFTATFLIGWKAPYTMDGTAKVRAGDRFRVTGERITEKPLGAHLEPVDYQATERRIIDEATRRDSRYTGYHFYFDTLTLNRDFTLIQAEA